MAVFIPNRSIDDILGAEDQEGYLKWTWNERTTPAVTAATATTGYNSWMRGLTQYVMPSMGANVAGAYCIHSNAYNFAAGQMMLAYETLLGSCSRAAGTDTFVPGSAMPSRRWTGKAGAAAQLVSNHTMLYVPATFSGAVGVVCTITYTNENGVSGRTATLTLGSNPLIGTAHQIGPHLQSGDLGIQSVQGISFSGGTTCSVRIYGILPLALHHSGTGLTGGMGQFMIPVPQPLLQAGDTLAIYRGGTTISGSGTFTSFFAPETI